MPTVELDGWKASYQDFGVGLPLVLIPGIEEYKESFLYQLRGLSDRYRVVSYDVRDASDGNCGDIEVLVQDLSNLMNTLRLTSAVIGGHSFGGLIAQQFAKTYPQRTSALLLISSFAKAPTQNNGKLLRYMGSGHRYEPESTGARLMKALGFAKPPEYNPEDHLDWVATQAAKTAPATVQARLHIAKTFDSRPWLEQLWMPLMAVVGQHDRPPFLSAAQMIQRATPDSEVEVIPDTEHFPHIQRHDLVNNSIDDFLSARLVSLID